MCLGDNGKPTPETVQKGELAKGGGQGAELAVTATERKAHFFVGESTGKFRSDAARKKRRGEEWREREELHNPASKGRERHALADDKKGVSSQPGSGSRKKKSGNEGEKVGG